MKSVVGESARPIEINNDQGLRWHIAIKLCCTAIAVAVLFNPDFLGQRLAITVTPTVDARLVAEVLSQTLASITLVIVVSHTLLISFARDPWARAIPPTTLALIFLAASFPLKGWLVDDAAITFAYSENLVRGFGLVLHPDHPPEEAYSNTLWLLMLAIPRSLGIDLPMAAKFMGLASGLTSILLTHVALERLSSPSPNSTNLRIIPTALLMSAPLLVWSNSGLEHGLQALLFILIAAAPLLSQQNDSQNYLWIQAGSLAALILLRPETPLILAAVLGTHLFYICEHEADRRQRWFRCRKLWPILFVPSLTLFSLIVFRWCYFGDILPNPYYAKATQSNFYGALNLLGGGWDYLFKWFTASAAIVCVPFLFIVAWRQAPLPILMATSIIIAQLLFILYAGGDWMHCWRFVTPINPLYALIVGYSTRFIFRRLSPSTSWILTTTITGFLVIASIKQYHRFLLSPTTPFQEVANVGWNFRSLAHRLGINSPRLAHHDAGGTSYAARLNVIDLAGLGNRSLAKHGKNAEFVANYILEQQRPHFVYGVDNFFAAATGFHLRPDFDAMYVKLSFPNKPAMSAPLCFIRRDLIANDTEDRVLTKEFDGEYLRRVIVKD